MSANAEYRVEEQLLGSVDSLLSFWPLVKEHPEIGPREALRILSTWSHLQRFSPALLDRQTVDRLHEAIQNDAAKLIERFSEVTFVDDWIDDAEALDESWDRIVDNDAADEADLSEIRLFDTLDRFSLACHASQKLLPQGSEMPENLGALIEEVAEGEDFLQAHPDIFLGAAEAASANLGRYRSDLDQVDERLWETVVKHRVLEEMLEERDAEPTQKLTQQEIDELFPAAPAIQTPLQEEPPAQILQLRLKKHFYRQRHRSAAAATSGDRSLKAAAATSGDRSLKKERLQIADLVGSVEGDPAVWVKLIPEIVEGGRNGLMIRVLGGQEDVGRYVKAIVSLGSAMEPREISLAFGAANLSEAEGEALSQTDSINDRIILRDRHDCERPVRW